MLAEERFGQILDLLNKQRTATVQELCEALGTSESTIRRDLTELDRLGKLNKVHGGATLPDSPFRSVTFLTTAIAKEMSYAGGLQRQALFSIALVLFVFIMIINVVLNVVLKGGSRDE